MELKVNGKTYINDGSAYYGLKVEPGSPSDNTAGKVGIHWVYLSYAPQTCPADEALAAEIRVILPLFDAAEKKSTEEYEGRQDARAATEDAEEDALRKTGLCPKCGTWCYGDCEAN